MKKTLNKDSKNISYDSYIKRITDENIPCYEPSVGKEELANLKEVIESNWLSEGKFVREFEEKLRILSNRNFSLAFNNCTAALITGMKSMGIGPGDEVIVQSLVHSADPNAIAATGAEPVFSEVNEKTLCLDIDSIKQAMTPNTKAVLHVALYGNTSDLDELECFCKENNLIFINDCAPALLGSFKNRSIASYGDFSALSFFADKTITTGEGGMLLTDMPDLLKEANIYKHDGRKERGVDLIERKGFNYRLTEMQAAIGVAQLEKINFFIKRKKENFDLYKSLLTNDNVKMFNFNNLEENIPHRNIIFVPNAKELLEFLSAKGIGARSLFMPMHSQPIFNSDKLFPVTERLFKTGVCLPSAPSLKNQDIEYVCDNINSFYSSS